MSAVKCKSCPLSCFTPILPIAKSCVPENCYVLQNCYIVKGESYAWPQIYDAVDFTTGATLCFFGKIAKNLGVSMFSEAEDLATGDKICQILGV